MVGSVRLLVVQPTPFCNLDCDYCYLPDLGDRSRLSFPVLEAARGEPSCAPGGPALS